MPVKTKRKGITEISVTDDAGDLLRFVASWAEHDARLYVWACLNHACVNPDDARALAAGLVEWADSVDPQ